MFQSRSLLWAAALLPIAVMAGRVAGKPVAKVPALDIGVSGTAGQILQPDPKLPGKFLWKMYVLGLSGSSQNTGYSGKLTGVTALLYQHGILSARLTAPVASGNSVQQVIIATGPGRVKARSLIEPGTTLEADKMTWHAKSNRIVATGNVVYHNGRSGVTMRVPRAPVVADTVLKSVSFGKGSATLP